MYCHGRRISLLCLILLAPSPGFSQSEPARISVLAEEFWPYSFSAGSGTQPQGILIDFASELIDATGMQHELHLLPWPRVMKRVREQENQLIITLIRTQEREDTVHWIGPVAEVNHALYGADWNRPGPVVLADLRSLVVATVVDDVANRYLENNGFSNLVKTSNHLKGLEMLTRGRVDLYPGNTALIEYQCAQLPGGCDNIVLVLPLAELEQELYFALSPQSDASVVNALRDHFDQLVAAGRLEAMQRTYLDGLKNQDARGPVLPTAE